MDETYSIINQKLQNPVLKHACLEKTSQELKVDGVGTTNLVVICDDIIFVGVDARGTYPNTKAFIMTEKGKKLFKIKYNILATMAGDSAQCEAVLNHVKNTMEINGDDGDIHAAATLAHTNIQRWQSESGQKFDGSFLIVGWENKNDSFHPYIYGVNNQGYMRTSTNYEPIGNGTGAQHAYPYYVAHKKCNSTREEMLELMKEALLYAAIKDPMSGGILRVAEVRPFGCNKIYSQRVLEVLFAHYDVVANCLSHSLFSLSYNHEYTYELNEKVDEIFKELKDYSHSVVVGLNRKFVVRLLHFKCPASGKYEQVKEMNRSWVQSFDLNLRPKPEHLYDRNVPHEIQALPWILINGFGESPVIFGEPTQKLMMKLLRDV